MKLARKLVIGVGWNRHVCVWQEIMNQKRAEIFTKLIGHTDDVLGVDFCEPNTLATSSFDVIFISLFFITFIIFVIPIIIVIILVQVLLYHFIFVTLYHLSYSEILFLILLLFFDDEYIWNIDSGYPRYKLSLNKEDERVGLEELTAIEKVLFLHKKRINVAAPLLSCGNDGYLRYTIINL